MRIFPALAALWAAGALAQGPGAGDTRTPPPAAPAHGAPLPGETAPAKAPASPETAAPAGNRSREASGRCAELSGTLRDQCLLEEQGAAGATSTPEPRTAPPPQNPR